MPISLFNNRGKIESWFAKPIYVRNGFATSEHEQLKNWLLEFFIVNGDFKRTPELNVNTTHLMVDLKELEPFKTFTSILMEEVNTFAKTMGYDTSENRLYMQNMWANLSRTGEYLFPHNHPGSFISGAYYVESTSDVDFIRFYDNVQSMIPSADKPNEYSSEYVQYPCTEQRLLLFKADLIHGCPALRGERKIVISFNIGLM